MKANRDISAVYQVGARPKNWWELDAGVTVFDTADPYAGR